MLIVCVSTGPELFKGELHSENVLVGAKFLLFLWYHIRAWGPVYQAEYERIYA